MSKCTLKAGHDMLFLGEKGQGKSRLMRTLVRFLDEEIPYINLPEAPLHDDPYRPITKRGRQLIGSVPADEIPIAWWPRDQRYAERLSPGTKFADIIGEIDPAKLAAGVSMGVEDALHFGLFQSCNLLPLHHVDAGIDRDTFDLALLCPFGLLFGVQGCRIFAAGGFLGRLFLFGTIQVDDLQRNFFPIAPLRAVIPDAIALRLVLAYGMIGTIL